MKPQSVVNVEELEKIRKCIDEIEGKAMMLSCFCQTVPTIDAMELDGKLKEILAYIDNNPNIIKQDVVNAFKSKPGFSRRVIFNIFRKLENLNLVLVKVDSVNRRHHHLFINHVDMLTSLITVLAYFKRLYFELIYKSKPFISGENYTAKITPVELVECLIMLYKFTKDKFSDVFLWHGKLCHNDTLHRKFAIIYQSMNEIVTELNQGLFDTKFVSSSEEMETFLNYGRSDVLGLKNLSFIISSFEKCGLRKYVEPIIDILWMLFRRKLPLLYNEYHHLSAEGKLNNWRDHVHEEIKNFPCKRKLLYCPSSN
ncbi:MAG TPA: hypothetical protein VFR94_00665 [Nitrososphaeraceae archaeon]|nr:hypothetical protein [Nitrososphaeraceae archaeon]